MECKLKDKTIISLEFDPVAKYLGLDKSKTTTISGMKYWVYTNGNWFWTPFSSLCQSSHFVQEFESYALLILVLIGFRNKRWELNNKRVN